MIPITIVDNFLDEPHQMVEFSKQLIFTPEPDGRWAGIRSPELRDIDPFLYDNINKKVIALFHDMESIDHTDVDVSMTFQKIPSTLHHGWVHNDNCFMTGILYLNENPLVNSGTSLYTSKEGTLINLDHTEQKRASNLRGSISEIEMEVQEEHNNQFEKTVDVKGKYNRLTLFHGNVHHSANNLGLDNGEDRLTLVMFFHRVIGREMPIDRMRTVRKL
jgi:hypothetical protein|tara:strand:+ start:81 stop:734 length:654 start_codon:yes stop_codon:yes gene_type:complete